MIIHNLVQGSDEWHEFRFEHDGASECAAADGISTKMKRTELLHIKATGTPKEFSEWVRENILDYGHVVEGKARPIIEQQYGIELYPVTCSEGRQSASCDGLTLDETKGCEHKQFNQALYDSVLNQELPEEYMPQVQQCLKVTKAKRWLFTVSDGTAENMASMWVYPYQYWFDRVDAVWNQFNKDRAAYVPLNLPEKPVAESIEQLPAVVVNVTGSLSLCNLHEVLPKFDRFIASAKTELLTDEDFVNADTTAAFSRTTAKALKAKAREVISQISSVNDVITKLELYEKKFDALGLRLEKLVEKEKEVRKGEIIKKGNDGFAAHIAALEKEIAPTRLIVVAPIFAMAIKGKRNLASMHDAVDTMLANKKIEVDAIAKVVRDNLNWMKSDCSAHMFLLNDLQAISHKQTDDFKLLVQSRIDAHKAAELARIEAETIRIREEERLKAEALVRAEQQAITDAANAEQVKAEAEKQKPVEIVHQAVRQEVTPQRTSSVYSGGSRKASNQPAKPTDTDLLAVIAMHYSTTAATALLWVSQIDLSGISKAA